MRNPCLDKVAADRNAKVLMDVADIPKETDFYKQLEMFRTERGDKSQHTNLFIPGKIVHLVDTKGDNSDVGAYAAYYACRYNDFNQVVISKRMKSDHSMMELCEVLEHMNLTPLGKSITDSLCNSIQVSEESGDEADTDIRLFMCCSNPNGRCPILMCLSTLVALILSWRSMSNCTFFARESHLIIGGDIMKDIPFSIGLFSYTLLQCEYGNCGDSSDKIIPSSYCVPYPDDENLREYMLASRASALVSVVFGGISCLLLCISTCLLLRERAWILITGTLLMSALFQGLVFLMKKSDLCITVDSEGLSIESICKISEGAIEAIVAGCLYFITAIGTVHFARATKGD